MSPEPTRRFVYLVPDGLPPTVIDSQVITLLRRMGERGVVFDLFVYQFEPSQDERAAVAARLAEIRRRLPGKVKVWTWPRLDVLVRRQRRAGDPTPAANLDRPSERRESLLAAGRRWALAGRDVVQQALILAALSPSIRRREAIVVHARGAAMPVALALKRWYSGFRVVADFRGDAEAEFLYMARERGLSLDGSLVRRERERLEASDRRVVRNADAVQCVSEALRRRLASAHAVPAEGIRVVPCLADEQRFSFSEADRQRLRHELGFDDSVVFVYSGSMAAWQGVEWLFTAWRDLRRALPQLALLVLAPELDRARSLAARNGLREREGFALRAASHDEVPGYLSAADVGVLVREAHPLNAVASPTKFAEYVLCGLPVLVSRGIGDLDALVEQHRLGIVLDRYGDASELERKAAEVMTLTAGRREERARRAQPVFGLGARLDEWAEMYRRL